MPPAIMVTNNDACPPVPAPERRDTAGKVDTVLALLNVTAMLSDQLRRMECRVAELERQIAAEGADRAADTKGAGTP